MLVKKTVSPSTLTKLDFGPNELRRAIANELGLKISTVYAWVINTFNLTTSPPYQSEEEL